MRQSRRLVVVGLIAALVVLGLATAIAYVFPPQPPTKVTQGNGKLSDCGLATVCAAHDPSGFTLTLSVNTTSIEANGSLTFVISIANPTSHGINVSESDDWYVPGLPASCICGCQSSPWAFEVFKGHYTLSNLSSGEDIIYPDVYPACVSFFFSKTVTVYSIPPAFDVTQHDIPTDYYFSSQVYAVDSGWVKSGNMNVGVNSLRSDEPSEYTLIAGDEWGDVVMISFSVVSPAIHPVEVVSVVGPVPPFNPGGPVVTITLKDISGSPVDSLAAALFLPSTNNPEAHYHFPFEVDESNPLMPGQSISSTITLIGAGFQAGVSYLIVLNGTLPNGASFAYTEQVQMVPPGTSTPSSVVG